MPQVALILGSTSDSLFFDAAVPYLEYFGLEYSVHYLSAHRNPEELSRFPKQAESEGYKIIIAAAGMAAHLAGAVAAYSLLPVLGVPLPGGIMDGMDALLSTVQMPAGIPVATFAVGKAGMRNAVVFAARTLALNDADIYGRLVHFKNAGSRL